MEYAMVLPYQDEQENVYPESYWVPDDVRIGIRNKGASVLFVGYRNKAAYLAHPDKPIVGATRFYQTKGPESWARFRAAYETANPMQHVWLVCMVYAKMEQEIGTPPKEGEEDTRVSFFKDAAIV